MMISQLSFTQKYNDLKNLIVQKPLLALTNSVAMKILGLFSVIVGQTFLGGALVAFSFIIDSAIIFEWRNFKMSFDKIKDDFFSSLLISLKDLINDIMKILLGDDNFSN